MRIRRVPPVHQCPTEKFPGIARSFAAPPSLCRLTPTQRRRKGPENAAFSVVLRRVRTVRETRPRPDQGDRQRPPVRRKSAARWSEKVCRSGQARKAEPLLLQPDSSSRLLGPRHHHRHSRRTTARGSHRDDADRAPPPATQLARAASRTRLRLSPGPDPLTATAPWGHSHWRRFASTRDLEAAHPQSSASASMPDREIPRHRSLFQRFAVSLPARPTQPSRKGPENAAFSLALRRLSHTTQGTRSDWLSELDFEPGLAERSSCAHRAQRFVPRLVATSTLGDPDPQVSPRRRSAGTS